MSFLGRPHETDSRGRGAGKTHLYRRVTFVEISSKVTKANAGFEEGHHLGISGPIDFNDKHQVRPTMRQIFEDIHRE